MKRMAELFVKSNTVTEEGEEDDTYADGEAEETSSEEDEDPEFHKVDFYKLLRVPKDAPVSRIRAAYHKLSLRWHPDEYGWEDIVKIQHARRMFRRITIAYLTLKDDARREIYDKHGYVGLSKSEVYCERNVFEEDPHAIFEAFYNGDDPEDREYLLLNGPSHLSEDEDEDDGEEDIPLEQLNAVSKGTHRGHGRGRGNRPPVVDDSVVHRASAALGRGLSNAGANMPLPADPWSSLSAKLEADVKPAVDTETKDENKDMPSPNISADGDSSPTGAPKRKKPLKVGALRKRRKPDSKPLPDL